MNNKCKYIFWQIFDMNFKCYYVEYIENIGIKVQIVYRDNLWWIMDTTIYKNVSAEVLFWRKNGINNYPTYNNIVSRLITVE